jgi:SAM-dependent methyltransferase
MEYRHESRGLVGRVLGKLAPQRHRKRIIQKAKTNTYLDISDSLIDHCKSIASDLQVQHDIHSKDLILKFILNHPQFKSERDALFYYFNDGHNSANILADLIYGHLNYSLINEFSLLEFASGYGCVSRHLPKHLPNALITSCDIHPDAVSFISSTFHIHSILSNTIPEDLSLTEKYDIVFALSFFSHMPRSTWGRWIKALYAVLKPNGFLIFTTLGKASPIYKTITLLPEDGFYFKAGGEQFDIDKTDYGATLATPNFVIKELYEQIKAPLALYREAFWWSHQDLYIVAKPS